MFQQRWEGSLNLSGNVRLAASSTRIYAVEEVNNRLRLVEVSPNCGSSTVKGNLFNSAGAVCRGLTWDETNGVLKALIAVGTAQYIYDVSITDGHAAAPKTVPSGTSLLYGLASFGNTLYSFDSAGGFIQITLTGSALNVNSVANARLTGVTAIVRDIHANSASDFLVAAGSSVHSYNGLATIAAVTLPAFSAGNINGVTKFGNNIYVSNDAAVRFARAVGQTAIGTALLTYTQTSESYTAVAQKNDGVIYMTAGPAGAQKLYQINVDGTATEIGDVGQDFTSLIWGGNALYGLTERTLYTVNTVSGASTEVGAVQAVNATGGTKSIWRWGFNLDSSRLVVVAADGSAYHVPKAGGNAGFPFINIGPSAIGGTYSGAYYNQTDANIVVRRQNTTTASANLLDPGITGIARGAFQINGTWFMVRRTTVDTTDTLRLHKLNSLFPEFYTQGSLIDFLYVDDPNNMLLERTGASETQIMPLAHGGKGPYTYAVRYNNTNTLPNGIEFNTTSRGLTVNPSVTPVGVYVLEYKVTDSESPTQSVSQAFLVRVGPAPGVSIGTLTVPSPQDTTLEAGTSHVVTLPAATQADGNIIYGLISLDTAAQELPAGFTWNDDTRTLAIDSSVAAGTYRFRYDVSDGETTTADAFSITLQPPVTLPTIDDVTVYDDQNFSETLPATSGGTGARSYVLQKVTPGIQEPPRQGTANLVAGGVFGGTVRAWVRNPDTGADQTGSASGATIDSNILAIYRLSDGRGFVLMKTTTPTNKRVQSITIDGTTHTRSANPTPSLPITIFGATRNVTRVPFTSFPTDPWNNVVFTLEDGTKTPGQTPGRTRPPSLDPLPAGMTFNTSSRVFAVADTAAVGTNTLRYTATVGAASKTEDFSVTVEDDDLLTLQSTSFIVHKGADRTVTLPAAIGGDSANYAYEIVEDPENPNFAARLDSSTRVLTIDDSETSVGRYTLRYTVTDGTQTATAIITINVLAAVVQLSLPTPANITLYKDEPNQSHSLPEASGGTAPYTYSLNQENGDPLPTGITFTPATRALSLLSSQVAAGTYSLDYQVTDSSSPQGAEDADFTVTVLASRPTQLALPTVEDINVSRGDLPTTRTLPAATGGGGGYRYSISSADSNISILLDGDTRVLTINAATPPGSYAVNYEVVDSDDNRVVRGFILRVTEDFALPVPTQINIRKGQAVLSVVLPAAVGTGPFTYAVTGLAAGITFLAATRTLRVDPTVAEVGTATLTYRATEGDESKTQNFLVHVRAKVQATTDINQYIQDLANAPGNIPTQDELPVHVVTECDPSTASGDISTALCEPGYKGESVAPLPAGVTFDNDTQVLTVDKTVFNGGRGGKATVLFKCVKE